MTYKVLMTEKPITEQQYVKLTQMGASIPFDPSALKYNIYLYVPLQDKDLIKQIKESLSCKDYGMEVTEQEVQKHLEKVKKFFAFNIGDTVLYRTKFKRLPFTVKTINEYEAVLQCRLRTLTFEVSVGVGLISLPNEDETTLINFPVMQATKSMLVIDFDSDLQLDDSDLASYFFSLLKVLLIIKTLYPRNRIVFSNPDATEDYIASILGATVVYGNLAEYINNRPSIILSDSPHHLAYTDGIIFPSDYSALVSKSEWESKYQLTSEMAYSYAMARPKCSPYLFEYTDTRRSKAFEYHSYLKNIDLVRMKELLLKAGADKYIHTLEKQIRIIHG